MILHYILHYAFLITFSFFCIINGPRLIYDSFNTVNNSVQTSELKSFKVSVYPPRKGKTSNGDDFVLDSVMYDNLPKKYIEIIASFDTIDYRRIYRVGDKEYNRTKKVLSSIGLLTSSGNDFLKHLPLDANREELNEIKVLYKIEKGGEYKFIKINNTDFVGKDYGVFVRVVKFIIGLAGFFFGILLLVVGTLTIRTNIVQYDKTGVLPRLTDYYEGLKSLLGLSKTGGNEPSKKSDSSEIVINKVIVKEFGGVSPELTLRKSGEAYLILELPPFYDENGNDIEEENFPELDIFENLMSDYIGMQVIRGDRDVFIIPNASNKSLEKIKHYIENYWSLRKEEYKR